MVRSSSPGGRSELRRRQTEVYREVLNGAQYRVRRHAAQSAERTCKHCVAQILEQRGAGRGLRGVLRLSRSDNAVHHFHSSYGPDPARRALPARLDGAELHRVSSHHRHVDGIVEDDDSAVPHHARSSRRTPRSRAAGRTATAGMNAPSGPPTWTARIGRPLRASATEVVEQLAAASRRTPSPPARRA